MSIKILINAIDPEECRVAIVKANNLEEFYIESASKNFGDLSSANFGSRNHLTCY